jgi:TolB protein
VGSGCKVTILGLVAVPLFCAAVARGSAPLAHGAPAGNPKALRGRAILFTTQGVSHKRGQTGGSRDIYLLAPTAPYVRNLTHNSTDEFEPAWSPDGRRIVFVRGVVVDGHSGLDLFLMNADGTGVRRLTLTPDLSETDPAWSPDGSRIAFSDWSSVTRRGIYVMQVASRRSRRIITGSTLRFPRNPVWSPDGTEIAFDRIVYRGLIAPTASIYLVGADGRRERRLTSDKGVMDIEPSWSPDGRKIAFERSKNLPDSSVCASSIWVIAPHGGRASNLTKVPCDYSGFGDMSPEWSWDGRAIASLSGRGGSLSIAVFHSDGTHPTVLLRRRSFGQGLAWQPKGG